MHAAARQRDCCLQLLALRHKGSLPVFHHTRPYCPTLCSTYTATDCALLQALYSNGGYTYLDVRTTLEVDEVGKIKDAVNIPFMLASRRYDPETREKKLVKEQNTEFIRQVGGNTALQGQVQRQRQQAQRHQLAQERRKRSSSSWHCSRTGRLVGPGAEAKGKKQCYQHWPPEEQHAVQAKGRQAC